jgi:Mrp family chromosome partitioning ATPase
MSALDQAFIRAYEKQTGPELAEPSTSPPDARRVVHVVPGPPSARLRRVAPPAPTQMESLEQRYAEGAWYRIDRPSQPAGPEPAATPEPVAIEPVAIAPAVTEPAVMAPTASQSAVTQPEAPVPAAITPAAIETRTAESTATKPESPQPAAIEPAAERTASQPAPTQAAPTQAAPPVSLEEAFSGVLTAEEIAQLTSVAMTPVMCGPDYTLDLLDQSPPQVEIRQADGDRTPTPVLPRIEPKQPAGMGLDKGSANFDASRAAQTPLPVDEASKPPTSGSPHEGTNPPSAADDRDIVRVQAEEAVLSREGEPRGTSQTETGHTRIFAGPKSKPAGATNLTPASSAKPDAVKAQLDAAPAHRPAAPTKPATRPNFQPEWEVDRFAWPEICEALYRDQRQYFSDAGQRLKAAATDGLNVLAITSPRRGEGKTTLALCLARCAVEAGLRVALIDADFTHPQLQTLLGMSETCSWHECFQNVQPLSDGAIVSREDELVIFPLTRAGRAVDVRASRESIAATVQQIASQFELVIIDLGSLDAGACELCDTASAQSANAVIVVRDLRRPDNGEIDDAVARIQATGISAVGIAENYGASS